MLTMEKIKKKFSVKEIEKKQAKKFLKIRDDPKLIIGLFKKKDLIGVCIGYEITKKELKKRYSAFHCKIENVMKWDQKIDKKFRKDEELRIFFEMGRYKISHKKFPKVCYATKFPDS